MKLVLGEVKCYLVGGINLWWGGNENLMAELYLGHFFWWRNKQICSYWGECPIPPPNRKNHAQWYCSKLDAMPPQIPCKTLRP